jgi:hypothetical protein
VYYFSTFVLVILLGLNICGCAPASVERQTEDFLQENNKPEIIIERDDSAATAVALVMCHCKEVKAHLDIVNTHNESDDAGEKTRLKAILPQSVKDMDSTCMGEFRKAANLAQNKQRFQRLYANMLYDSCPAIAKGLHVTGATKSGSKN